MPLVGVEPNASHLPDECPRLLDHRDFPDVSQITYPSDSCMSTTVAINIHKASSAHPFCTDVLQLRICSMHLPDGLPSSKYLKSQNVYTMKIFIFPFPFLSYRNVQGIIFIIFIPNSVCNSVL